MVLSTAASSLRTTLAALAGFFGRFFWSGSMAQKIMPARKACLELRIEKRKTPAFREGLPYPP
jgi:hypothetical protein